MKPKIPAQNEEKADPTWSPLMLHPSNPALRPAVETRWPSKAFKVLGTLLIVVALITITWNILVLGQATYYTVMSPGLWGGVLLLVTGILAAMAGVKKTPCLVVATLVLAMLAISANFVILGFGSIEVIEALSVGEDAIDYELVPPNQVAWNSSNKTTDYEGVVISDQGFWDGPPQYADGAKILLVFTILIVATGIVSLTLLLAVSICSCRRLCKPSPPVVIYAMPRPMLGTNAYAPGIPLSA